MFKILLFFLIFVQQNIFAGNVCRIESDIIVSILGAEGHPKRRLGYEYLIGFNNESDARLIRKFVPELFLDSRTVDCKNPMICKTLTEKLLSMGIINVDLGGFQLNPRWHKYPIDTYFDFSKSYKVACAYIEEMVAKYGYNWYAIASYHSQTPEFNQKYQRALKERYVRYSQIKSTSNTAE